MLLITTLNYYKMTTHGSKEKNTTAEKGTAQLQANRQPTESSTSLELGIILGEVILRKFFKGFTF
jgi:hypothetical protein